MAVEASDVPVVHGLHIHILRVSEDLEDALQRFRRCHLIVIGPQYPTGFCPSSPHAPHFGNGLDALLRVCQSVEVVGGEFANDLLVVLIPHRRHASMCEEAMGVFVVSLVSELEQLVIVVEKLRELVSPSPRR